MKNRLLQKIGFIGVEVAIVASIVLVTGFAAVNSFSARTTNTKDELIGQFANSQLNLGGNEDVGGSGALTQEQINQLKADILSVVDAGSIANSVLALINVEQLKADLADSVNAAQITQDILDAVNIPQIKSDILSEINVVQIKSDILSSINVAQIKSDVLASINIPQLKADILADVPTDADTLDGYHASSFVLAGSPSFTGVLTTSGQIKFPSTQSASSDVNTLDDYEEGTFTPSFTSTGNTFTYNAQRGTFTKIGRQVTVSFVIDLKTKTVVNSNAVTISGLPYASTSIDYGFSGT